MSGAGWKDLKGSHRQYQYDWINVPPVIEVRDSGLLRSYADQMRKLIKKYDKGEYETYDDNDNLIEDVDNWNDRVKNAKAILRSIADSSKNQKYEYNLVYRVLGWPLGILCADDDNPVHIYWLVAHPGTDNAGGTLLELAADWSESRHKGGRLDLYSYDRKSTVAYKAMGFIKEDGKYDSGGRMTLDPRSATDTWVKAGANWKLRKYLGKGYYNLHYKPPSPTAENG